MDGIIIVDKSKDWTSFDVCAKLRNLTKTKKVGHSGTLDPMATGVLPVFLGKATKSIKNYINGDKEYIGEMTLGAETDTMDAEGKLQTSNIKIQGNIQSLINKNQIEEIFKKYTGKIKQKPPMFSAKKVNGQPLYKLARKGIVVDRPEKEVEIYSLELLTIEENRVCFRVKCSKGSYIRVLAHEIGKELGVGAYLSALKRTFSEPFSIDQAYSIDRIIDLSKEGRLDTITL